MREEAVGLLAKREHSQYELKQKLSKKGHADDEINSLLVNLAREGLQCDRRYTEAYVRYRVEAGFGPRRIKMELGQRGISGSLINEYLPQDDEFWWQILLSLWQKKYHKRRATTMKEYMQQLRFLTQRGFEPSMIYKLLGNF